MRACWVRFSVKLTDCIRVIQVIDFLPTRGESERSAFREELASLQVELRKYSRILADIAGVEDLTDLEATE